MSGSMGWNRSSERDVCGNLYIWRLGGKGGVGGVSEIAPREGQHGEETTEMVWMSVGYDDV